MAGYILIVEDEQDMADPLAWSLRKAGYEVEHVTHGKQALQRMRTRRPDLVLLDWMLPDIDGVEVCRRIRRDPATRHVAVMMLTARDDEIDRVVGFEVGADDYVVKPFSMREVTLRIRAILNRPRELSATNEACVLELDDYRVVVHGKPVALTASEAQIMRVLSARRGAVVSRHELLGAAWKERTVSLQALDSQLKRLRAKLGDAGHCLQTVRGAGVRLTCRQAR